MSDEKALQLVRDMVAIPSVNPMGRDVSGDHYLEAGMADFVFQKMKQLKMDVELCEVSPGRPNVVGTLEKKGKPTLLLDSHLDTVPVDGMPDPFNPVVKDGQLFGRGSCDTKSTMSMFLTAIEELNQEGKDIAYSIVLAGTIDEELHANGARHLVEKGLRPDFAIMGEPTELNIIHAHKGCVRFVIETFGKSCHSSLPELGNNALYLMAEILLGIKKLGENLPTIIHPELGSPTISPGTINGGLSVNAVPDHCEINIDVRLLPGQSMQDILGWLKDSLSSIDPSMYKIRSPHLDAMALYTEKDASYSKGLMDCCHRHYSGSEFSVASFATDAQAFSPLHIPCLVFGPGSITVAHTRDEFLPISELRTSINILKDFLIKDYI